MTRSTSINNAELRKMSTPIPISVNTWQMRSPDQYLNLDDSNQFDSGIMEQCISQSSVSPSSAASYSFSPIAYNSNQSSKEAKLLNRTNLGHNSSSLASSNQIYQNQSQADKTGSNSNNNYGSFINDLTSDPNSNNNPLNSSNTLNQFTYDNFTSVDLATANEFFSDDDRNACDLINNDLSNLNTNFYNHLGSDDVSLPVELVESLLINATLSDHSNKNIMIPSNDDLVQSHSQINDNRSFSRCHNDDSNEEQNANNNINPMFLFNNKPNNKISQFSLKQSGNMVNSEFPNQPNHSHTTNQTQSNPLQSISPHKATNKPSFNSHKIDEEGEDIYNSDLQQSSQLQYCLTKKNEYASSLPVDSYLSESIYRPSYQHQTAYDSHTNNINQIISKNHQMSDPVLTQIQLNNKPVNFQHHNLNKPVLVSNNFFISNKNDNFENRKINYLLNHQNVGNNAQTQNLITNNIVDLSSQQFSTSMSLPAPTNLNSNEYRYITHPQFSNQIKVEPNDKTNQMYYPVKNTDENDENFSKLKLSSPCSSNASNSSPSPASSSSANCSHGNYQASLQNSATVIDNTYQEKNITRSDDLESINSSELFTSSLNGNDVISALTTSQNPTSNDLKSHFQQKNENNFYNQMNRLTENSSTMLHENSSNLLSQLDIKEANMEEYFKNANDSNTDQLNLQSNNNTGSRVRRRATVSFSRNEEDCEDIYNDDCDENGYEDVDNEDSIENDKIQDTNTNVSTTGAIAINRRRNSRSISGASNKLSKSFSTQNVPKRRQFNINQLCIGSVGSSSQLYMIQQQRSQLPVNTRKQARTSSTLNYSNGGVDVHSFNQSTNKTPIQHLTSSNSKDMFSNIQFSPFSSKSSDSNAPNLHINTQNFLSSNSKQQTQGYLSTSLPAKNNLETIMLNNIGSNRLQENNMFASSNNNNHPNLNKLLNNSENNQSQLFFTESNLDNNPAAGSTQDQQFAEIDSNLEKKNLQKKKHTKKQETFHDAFDNDSDDISDGESIIESSKKGDLKKPFKLEDSDLEDDSDSDSDSNDCLNTTRNSLNSNGSFMISQSASSSYINNESLFDLMMSSKSRDAYFWQYNIQSKGPKTKKVLTLRNKDPHLHRDFFDPVYQLQSLNARGGTSVNKLRKGDGNDVTPNPEKLFNLGNQIKDFIQKSYQMNNDCFSPPSTMMSSSSLNQLITSKSNNLLLSSSVDTQTMPKEKVNLKREKNKIASRACRLKKKAQHEANKIKLFGLNDEHKQLLDCISSARELIRTRLTEPQMVMSDQKMIDRLEERINQRLKTKLAGNSDGYVHMLMLQVEKDRLNHKKSSLDLNNFNHQYALFQQHEKQILHQEQHIQDIKVEHNIQNTNFENSQQFIPNEKIFSPKE